jgi:MoaA/NifB/PqqE/SkfB family radical SAM enzyme
MKDWGYEQPLSKDILSQTLKILNQIPKLELDFLGGEPTLYDGLTEFVDSLENREYLSCMVFSNGSKPEVLGKLNCNVSISYHTDYHSQGYLKNVRRAIESRRSGKHLTCVNFVCHKRNYSIVEEAYNYLKDSKPIFKFIREKFSNLGMKFEGVEEYECDSIDYLLGGELLSKDEKRRLFIENPNFYNCMCKMNSFIIDYKGDIFLNCIKDKLGNIKDSTAVDYFKPKLIKCPFQLCRDCFHQIPKYIS